MNKTGHQRALLAGVAGLGLLLVVAYFVRPHSAVSSRETIPRRTGNPLATQPTVRFQYQFEGAPKMKIRQVGKDHYAVSFPGAVNYFIFKVDGAAGRTLRFTFEGVPAEYWSAVRPVVGYGSDISDAVFFELDSEGRERWHYFGDPTHIDVSRREIIFAHSFSANSAFVALRVPYSLGYQEKWLQSLKGLPGVEVITIG
ncbi:MAG: hypothetical protein QOE14_210, partial [Humisphaera sp.]|nr:hypothetical protein [Humisphaera sp.]